MESVLGQFNKTVVSFVADLKTIFGESDREILLMEGMCDMLKMNARLVIRPFQAYILGNPEFVKNINQENIDFFLQHEYSNVVNNNAGQSDYVNQLIGKFKQAAVQNRSNTKTVGSIFNWFKVMIYFAYQDEGKDPVTEINRVCEAVFACA